MNIGIVGLGLMGGSLGLALREKKFVTNVCGCDILKEHEEQALSLGLVDKILSFEQLKKECDVIFLTISVEGILKVIKNLDDIDSNTTIIDFGSTKERIFNSIPDNIKQNFVLAHPMAGTENSGPKASLKNLYDNATIVICESNFTDNLHLKRGVEIFSHLGMKIVFMNSKEHDMHVAIISHLPHIISFSLSKSVLLNEDKDNIAALGGPTFKDMVRVAKSSPLMWQEIFKQNRTNVLNAIKSFKSELSEFEKLVDDENWNELYNKIEEAGKIKEIL